MKYQIYIAVFFLLSFITGLIIIEDYGPAHFPEPVYNFEANPLLRSKIDLGKRLFYDPILSSNEMISCASCHSPYNAFAHTDHDLSHGIHDSIGTRNAPPLFNLAWATSFNWDGAIHHLDMQALAPINDAREMGSVTAEMIAKLNNDGRYRVLFEEAWLRDTVTTELFLKSLSQFLLTLVSSESKYDQVVNGTDSFSLQEQKGYDIFLEYCNSCHTEPLFTNYQFENNGLKLDPDLLDFGRGVISQKSRDSLLFKVPSLRNLSYTYPYMHDGRFDKLREVIDHYVTIDVQAYNVSHILREGIDLEANDRIDLIAFLKTLDDPHFCFNEDHRLKLEILD